MIADGIQDDTEFVQAWIRFAGWVPLPPGTYRITRTLPNEKPADH
jgi:predicted solute-binding protein